MLPEVVQTPMSLFKPKAKKSLLKAQSSHKIVGRDIFKPTIQTAADVYDYTSEARHPKRSSVSFSQLSVEKPRVLQKQHHSLDYKELQLMKIQNKITLLQGRQGREGRDPFTVESGMAQNVKLDNRQIPQRSKHQHKSCFKYDFGTDFDDFKSEILHRD